MLELGCIITKYPPECKRDSTNVVSSNDDGIYRGIVSPPAKVTYKQWRFFFLSNSMPA